MLATIEAPAVESIEPERQFSYHDRCDLCGFQGYVVASKENKELVFCHHHGNIQMVALAQAGWSVSDFSEMLKDKA